MAKPQFGTTATQAVCLFEVLGNDAARRFYTDLRNNEIAIVAGNKQVAQGVARGDFAIGITDSDDAIAELDSGKPVAILFPDRAGHPAHPRLGTLFIPNTIAIVKNGPNPDGARRLVDTLIGTGVEKQLAEGGGFQIPLNPRTAANVHPALLRPEQVKTMQVDWERAAEDWEEVQAFLRNEFGR